MDKFLLTGFPRIRSAWFTALFNTVTYTEHEQLDKYQFPIEYAVCDPLAACLFPITSFEQFKGNPIVLITREFEHSIISLEENYGISCSQAIRNQMKENHVRFCNLVKYNTPAPLVVPFTRLNDYNVVNQVFKYCTGLKLDKKVWSVFDLLNIQQDGNKIRKLVNGQTTGNDS